MEEVQGGPVRGRGTHGRGRGRCANRGSGLLMLLEMVTTTTNSLLFWAFRIKRLEASYVCG